MEISKFNQLNPITTATTSSKTTVTAGSKTPVTPESESARISHDFELLSQAQKGLGAIPEVNSERVAEVQQSIKDGSFNIDPGQVAEAMFQQHAKK